MNDVDVQGTVADGFEPVRDAFVRNFTERGEVGAAVSVYRDGRPVADLWGGTRDGSTPWTADTLTVLRSVTKGPASAVPHLLHQRGQLDLDAPIGTYWPEFKAHGKERVRVRHLLAHRAGVPALDRPLTLAEAVDGVSGSRAVAAQAPEWEPGTAHGYHPYTYGWLLGELVLRVTSRTLGRWFAQEVAGPLGLDLWIGLPPSEEGRMARTEAVEAPARPAAHGLRVRPKQSVLDVWADPGSLTRRAFGAVDTASTGPGENDPAYHAAELPASGGIGTARAVARCYAALAGDLDGQRGLFTPATRTQARSEESFGPDRVLVVNTRFGLGFMLHSPASPMLGPTSFGHPGRGGSLAFADPESGTGFAYVTRGAQRNVTSDPRSQALVRALRHCG